MTLPSPDDPTVGLPAPAGDAPNRGAAQRQEALTIVRRAHRLHYLDDAVRDELEAYYQRPAGTYPVSKALAERGVGEVEQAVLSKDFAYLERRQLLLTETLAKVRPLAEGGMGVVWLGWDAELDRSLAVKVIKRFTATSSQRFEREAKAMALVGNHPHCLSVHHVGLSHRTGEPFFSMPLIQGSKTLGSYVERFDDDGPPPIEPVVRWGYQIALALQACHEARLIHRDIKPSNILIDATHNALLTDFGVVSDLDTNTLLTQHASIVGTFQYMPLEQLRGEPVDPRADIYALGASLYHVLTGQVPYPSRTLADLVRQGVEGDVLPPTHLRPDLPLPLEAVLLRCLRRDRDDRYDSAADLAAALARLLPTDSDTLPLRPSPSPTTSATPTRSPWPWLAGGLLTGGVAGALGVWIPLSDRPKPPTPAPNLPAKLAQAQSDLQALTAHQTRTQVYVDRARLDLLTDRARTGLPYASRAIPDLQAWLTEAKTLVARAPSHRARLAALDPNDPTTATERAALEQLLQALARLTKTFPTQPPLPDTIASIEARLAFASTVRERTITSPTAQAAWSKAIAAIKAHPPYNGLTLKPIDGLLPLGPDPKSGLWEFWHLATGDRPVQDQQGHWRLTIDSGLVMVLIPGGTFLMGSDEGHVAERPRHERTLNAFLISKYELPQAQWLRATGRNPSFNQPPRGQFTLLHPVEGITWSEALQTISRLELALPSEAEWEGSTRAGTTSPWWCGANPMNVRRAGNIADARYRRFGGSGQSEAWDDGHVFHAPVGSFPANQFGLHDVVGNVSEWVGGNFQPYPNAPNPARSLAGRGNPLHRGGAWDLPASLARSSVRMVSARAQTSKSRGVRPARHLLNDSPD